MYHALACMIFSEAMPSAKFDEPSCHIYCFLLHLDGLLTMKMQVSSPSQDILTLYVK